jgi:hypothetical protein
VFEGFFQAVLEAFEPLAPVICHIDMFRVDEKDHILKSIYNCDRIVSFTTLQN